MRSADPRYRRRETNPHFNLALVSWDYRPPSADLGYPPQRPISSGDALGGMVDINLTQLGLEFGSGAFIGAIVGFAAKKIAKVIAVIIGVELALFKFLESKGFMVVRWDKLTAGILSAPDQMPATDQWIEPILSTLSVGVGFSGGFLLGFKKG